MTMTVRRTCLDSGGAGDRNVDASGCSRCDIDGYDVAASCLMASDCFGVAMVIVMLTTTMATISTMWMVSTVMEYVLWCDASLYRYAGDGDEMATIM